MTNLNLGTLDWDIFARNKPTPFLLRLEKFEKESTQIRNHIVRNGYFADIHMACGHKSLGEIAKKRDINIEKLEPGQFVAFMNRPQNAIKLFTAGNTIAYLKTPHGERINPTLIRMIPRFFNGSYIDYQSALKKFLIKKLK